MEERDRLLAQGEGLVRALAIEVHRTLPASIDVEDLMSDGRTGLIQAADRYDPRMGATFETFAYYRVRGAIYDGLRRMGWMSRRQWAKHRAAERADDFLSEIAERDAAAATSPVPAERSDAGELADTLAGLATIFLSSVDPSELEEQVASDAELALPADAALEKESGREAVRAALGGLPERERQLLEMVYFGDKTIKEAGEALGLSKSWASRLHARAIELLRDTLDAGEVDDSSATG